jgi:hypothetical protein
MSVFCRPADPLTWTSAPPTGRQNPFIQQTRSAQIYQYRSSNAPGVAR